jgi:hypothetical protein
MAHKDIIIGRAINLTGMIGVSAGIVLMAFGIVLLLFRRGFGFDIANPFTGFGSWRGGLLRALKSNRA